MSKSSNDPKAGPDKNVKGPKGYRHPDKASGQNIPPAGEGGRKK
ncbi:hypothetical protein [Dactylosporangium roseum]|nr:hypothetical protein [Dactylosporangium roseum]